MSDIEFVPLTEKHLALLHQWFQIPHVKKWYARDVSYTLEMIKNKYLPRIKDNKKIPNYIVALDTQPIGYIQMYSLEYGLPDGVDSYDHPLFKKHSANRIAGIDLYIAETANLRIGIGSRMLDQFIKEKIINNFDLVVVDPHKMNEQAIKFFTKNGFKEFNNINTQSGHLILAKKCRNEDYFILTGAMGAGKSTILKELRKLGLLCIDEPARQILAEQRSLSGNGVPDNDPKLFTELLLSRSIYQFKQMETHQEPVIYDRGIPDNIGYANLFDLDLNPYMNAARQHQYNRQVFFIPPWEAIYENDNERKMTFEQAKQFGEDVRKIYENFGYSVIDVPLKTPVERAEFIYATIARLNNEIASGADLHAEVIQWACKNLESHGYVLKSNIPEKVQHTPWSHVVRFKTTDGFVYLKQTPPAIALEATIIQTLHDQFHAQVPVIIDSDTKLNCFLMKDAGLALRQILKQKFDEKLLCRAIDQFTSLQITASEKFDVLLKIGVPDWRLDNFPDLYKEVFSEKSLLIADGLTDVEIAKSEALISKVYNLCEELSTYKIKQTIVQPDFNDNNTLIDQISQAITVIDLGEIVISHPFFSLLNCLQQIKKHHGFTDNDDAYIRIKNCCFTPYMNDKLEEKLPDAIATAEKLWIVYGILALYRLIHACDKEQIMSVLRGKLSNSFREFLSACKTLDESGGTNT